MLGYGSKWNGCGCNWRAGGEHVRALPGVVTVAKCEEKIRSKGLASRFLNRAEYAVVGIADTSRQGSRKSESYCSEFSRNRNGSSFFGRNRPSEVCSPGLAARHAGAKKWEGLHWNVDSGRGSLQRTGGRGSRQRGAARSGLGGQLQATWKRWRAAGRVANW